MPPANSHNLGSLQLIRKRHAAKWMPIKRLNAARQSREVSRCGCWCLTVIERDGAAPSLGRIFLEPAFVAPEAQHPSQLGRQRIAVARPADEPGVLELLDVRQVAQALEPEVGEER